MCAPSRDWKKADILQPGYAIEYDYVDARELYPTLENRKLPRLFLRWSDQWHNWL